MKVLSDLLFTTKRYNSAYREKFLFLNYRLCKNYSIVISTLNSVKINSTNYCYVLTYLKVISFGIILRVIILMEQD